MKVVASFSISGEAAFLQSILTDAGISSDIQDGGYGVEPTRVQLAVADEDAPRALEIVAHYRAAQVQTPGTEPAHPASGFPFLGIIGFVGLLWGAGTLIRFFATSMSDGLMKDGVMAAVAAVLLLAVSSVITGMVVGICVSIVCLVAKVTWHKLKNA